MRALAVILALASLSTTAQALPPDRLVNLPPGDARFEKGPQGTWKAISSDPEIVEARYHDTAEVSLQAHKEGVAIVMLANLELGQAWFWKVRVAEKTQTGMPDPAVPAKACKCGKGKPEFPMICQVENQACLEKLHELFTTTDLTQEHIKIRYTVEGLQALLKKLEPTQKDSGVSFAFSGVNLRLTGKLPDQAAWHRLLLSIYKEMVGKLVIDNRIEIPGI